MILIRNAAWLILNADTIRKDMDVLIDGSRIAAIGKRLPADRCETVMDASGKIVFPGLIDAHTHINQRFCRSVSEQLQRPQWEQRILRPILAAAADVAEVEAACGMLSAIDMVRAGITSFVDVGDFSEERIGGWNSVGLRGTTALRVADRWSPGQPAMDGETQKATILDTLDRWQFAGNTRLALAPESISDCTPGFLNWLKDTAYERNLPLFCRVSENHQEIDRILRDTGMMPLQYLQSIGFLDKPFCAVHGVHFTEYEIELCVDHGISVCYCPKSNMKLASGVAPIALYLEEKIGVALGTDGACGNDLADMLEEMRTGLLLQKLTAQHPAKLLSSDVFRMATETSAKVCGLDAGMLAPGKLADIVMLNPARAHMLPVYDALQSLVLSGKTEDVETVLIDGRVVMMDGVIQTLDEQKELTRIGQLMERVHEAAFAAGERE